MGLTPNLRNHKLWMWGPDICVLTNSLRTIALGYSWLTDWSILLFVCVSFFPKASKIVNESQQCWQLSKYHYLHIFQRLDVLQCSLLSVCQTTTCKTISNSNVRACWVTTIPFTPISGRLVTTWLVSDLLPEYSSKSLLSNTAFRPIPFRSSRRQSLRIEIRFKQLTSRIMSEGQENWDR